MGGPEQWSKHNELFCMVMVGWFTERFNLPGSVVDLYCSLAFGYSVFLLSFATLVILAKVA